MTAYVELYVTNKFEDAMKAFQDVLKAEKEGKLKDVPVLGDMIEQLKEIGVEGSANEDEFKAAEEQFKNWPPKE